ncbi:MAG: folylpolyglutamate synthase/dihydrofolate synthase family protein [Elainellaceae cyanobacterium]
MGVDHRAERLNAGVTSVVQPAAGTNVDSAAEATLNQLLERTARAGVHLGLEQVRQLLDKLDCPHHSVPVVHVAGTNGKGSVCAYLSSVLTQAGYRTGRYTSPHLVSWTERICIDERSISSQALYQLLHTVTQTAATHGLSPTQFELVTAAAWLYFAQQAVDIAIVEVGLGGRLDATNVCDRPLATAITTIGWDHWQRLGPTLADIAGEKAGILKPGVPAVVGPLPAAAADVITQRSQTIGCPMAWVHPAHPAPSPASSPASGMPWVSFVPPSDLFSPLTYPVGLLGSHQHINSAIAIALLQLLQGQGWDITPEAIQIGMAQVSWPARLQWMQWRGKPLLVDGAHNADAAKTLRQYLDQHAGQTGVSRTYWVIGMLDTKDHSAVLTALLRPGDRICCVPVPGHQTADPKYLASEAHLVCPQITATVAADVFQGLDKATSPQAAQRDFDYCAVLCGSLYLIGDMLTRMVE